MKQVTPTDYYFEDILTNDKSVIRQFKKLPDDKKFSIVKSCLDKMPVRDFIYNKNIKYITNQDLIDYIYSRLCKCCESDPGLRPMGYMRGLKPSNV